MKNTKTRGSVLSEGLSAPRASRRLLPGVKTDQYEAALRPTIRAVLGAQAVGEAGVERRIDVNALRQRSDTIPRDKPVWVYCEVGQRGYYAQRLLVQRGLQAVNVLGGMKSYRGSWDQPSHSK